MAIKVSVVVPVYNPGRHIDGLLASLRRQSLPPDEFETIFVDDGSTDGTRERLEALAAEVANFRVIAIPRSGWPGRPRNVGIDAARGEYIQFVDNDDELGDEALERLWDYAKANGSDIVIGREVRRNRRKGVGPMFRKNRPRAILGKDPLFGLLTPHKMFRRDFLNERDIRFLEGPRRLEDHHFVVKAYFRADVISVLADYPCYYWVARRDRSNAGRTPYEWFSYYGYVRDILDVVEAHTEPGPFRDRLLAHWYRGKGLRKLKGSMASPDEENARTHFEALRQLAQERFPRSVDDHLDRTARIQSALLRAGEFDLYRELAKALGEVHMNERLEYLRAADGALELRVVATLAYGDGTPVTMDDRDGGAIRTARLRPQTADHGRPMQLGSWELSVQVFGVGVRAKGLLRGLPSDAEGRPSRQVVPFASASGKAKLVAIPPRGGAWRLKARLAAPPVRARTGRIRQAA